MQLSFIFTLLSLFPSVIASGLTLDTCSFHSDCLPSYLCLNFDLLPCRDSELCACIPSKTDGLKLCHSHSACSFGEECITAVLGGLPLRACVSKTALGSGRGYTLDRCSMDIECQTGRRCFNTDMTECTGSELCSCLPADVGEVVRTRCARDADCEAAEICAKSAGETFCVSRSLVERDDGRPVDGAGCVDARLLGESRVYEKDRWANVLCDMEGSCATAGHMVEWEGRVMRMSVYCQRVQCERRRMWVNSQKGWERVESRTNGLLFLSVAARWNTRWEEMFLRGLVRGLGV